MPVHLQLQGLESGTTAGGRADSPVRVVLADDHTLMRRGLRLLLDGAVGVDVVGEAADLETTVRQVYGYAPDVLVLDLRMPGGSSIDTIRMLRQEMPRTEIVAISMERSAAYAQRAIDLGAIAFVVKDNADTELPAAVRAAALGEEYVSTYLAAGLEALRASLRSRNASSSRYDVT